MDRERTPISSILILLGIFLLLGYEISRWTAGLFRRPAVDERLVSARGDLAADELSTIELFKKVKPSVVYITTTAQRLDMRTLNVLEVPQGTGSGFVWDDAGDIVTNFHVLEGAAGARVTLANHKTYDARLVGASPEHDLAVLRISAPAEELPPIPIGTSDDLQVGQKVFAIGNPFGLDQTLTTGIVSAVGRSIPSLTGEPITNVIQTDAAINPGNSGGPLLDSAGRLIGVNTAIVQQRGYAGGIGFAIPVDTVNRVVAQLIAAGRVIRPELGIRTSDAISQNLTAQLGLRGVLFLEVLPGSPAAKAGLRPTVRTPDGRMRVGDIVLAIDGRSVRSFEDLYRALGEFKVGQTVVLKIWRDGETLDVEVELTTPSR